MDRCLGGYYNKYMNKETDVIEEDCTQASAVSGGKVGVFGQSVPVKSDDEVINELFENEELRGIYNQLNELDDIE